MIPYFGRNSCKMFIRGSFWVSRPGACAPQQFCNGDVAIMLYRTIVPEFVAKSGGGHEYAIEHHGKCLEVNGSKKTSSANLCPNSIFDPN